MVTGGRAGEMEERIMTEYDADRADAVRRAVRRVRQAEGELLAAVARRERMAYTTVTLAEHEATRDVWESVKHAAIEAEATADTAWAALDAILVEAGVL